MKTNLFVISDSPITFAGLEAIIEQDERFALTGRAVGSSDVTRCLEDTELQPDVVILGEPSSKRIKCEAVQQIVSHYHRKKSRSKIIVVSEQDEDDVTVAATMSSSRLYGSTSTDTSHESGRPRNLSTP